MTPQAQPSPALSRHPSLPSALEPGRWGHRLRVNLSGKQPQGESQFQELSPSQLLFPAVPAPACHRGPACPLPQPEPAAARPWAHRAPSLPPVLSSESAWQWAGGEDRGWTQASVVLVGFSVPAVLGLRTHDSHILLTSLGSATLGVSSSRIFRIVKAGLKALLLQDEVSLLSFVPALN